MRTTVLTIVSLVLCASPALSRKKERLCCSYSHGLKETECQSKSGCLLTSHDSTLNGSMLSPSLERCSIPVDSKRDAKTLQSKRECMAQSFDTSTQTFDKKELPFFLRAYIFDEPSVSDLPGVELFFKWRFRWSNLRFRLFNTEICDEDGSNIDQDSPCYPRCVEIVRNKSEEENDELDPHHLVYDCEVGFFPTNDLEKNNVAQSTGGATYELDICLDVDYRDNVCGSYLFRMPNVINGTLEETEIILIEKKALVENHDIILHIPDNYGLDGNFSHSEIGIFETSSEEKVVIEKIEFFREESSETIISTHLDPGSYEIVIILKKNIGDSDVSDVIRWIEVARFYIPAPNGSTIGLTVAIILLVAIGGAGFYLYRRYQWVKTAYEVNPQRLLESGRIAPKEVFIITNVDNKQHIEIVSHLSKYLRAHCGVGKIHFALDPETGIASQPEHDPWKWAQSTADLMAENGYLVFIGAPPTAMGQPIYKDLPNNQAFVSAKYLRNMDEENRLSVLHLPYSDPATVPTLLPPHVRAKALMVPRQMNEFLSQLLQVKKRELCGIIPLAVVQPQVAPHDLSRFSGGAELLDKISNLTAKVELQRAESKQRIGNGTSAANTLSHGDDSSVLSDSEERGLLRPATKSPKQSSPLEIEIEPNVLSLRGLDANRDKSLNSEFA